MNQPKSLFLTLLSVSILSIAATKIGNNNKLILQKQGIKKIVIDAGHGGSDYGAVGKYSNEKDVSLAVALKLQDEIKSQMPDVVVFLTRTTDIYDNVHEKANKANAAKGDLFISIHCNDAGPNRHSEFSHYTTRKYKKRGKTYTEKVPHYRSYTTPNAAKGTETYIWGVDKNDDKEKALRENQSLFDDSANSQLKNFNPEDPEQNIAISLKMQQYAERSKNLAFSVQDEFVKVGRVNRDARQRAVGIWVLQAVSMPAILVELGFISNPEEENYLNSKEGQKQLSECIARAVKNYKQIIESKINNSNK
jgi:N-acetylmuramoyl-L-alanine amidase